MLSDTQKLIEFRSFPEPSRSPRFVVLYCTACPQHENLFCLTPHVMRWASNIYLMDLNSCINYWRQQAVKAQTSILALYEDIIALVFGKQSLAVFCDHPWQGLCFIDDLMQCDEQGGHHLNSRFNQGRYQRLSWASWFNTLKRLGEHLDAMQVRHFRASVFNSKTAQLQRFIQRLDLYGPYELADADVASISRRYSGWVGNAWGWTFVQPQAVMQTSFETSRFPWRPIKDSQAIQVKRHLDYPVSQWDMVEPLLKDDFNRLCLHRGWLAGDKINAIEWTITLFNMQQVTVYIGFRNPYSLHHESPHFKSALYQAYYAYMAMMQSLIQRDTDLDLPEAIPFISWQLDIHQRLQIPQKVMDLFPEDIPGATQQQILDLQNCLPCNIEHYAIQPDFMPEQVFKEQTIGESVNYGFSLQQWQQGLLRRPLFYYPQPVPIAKPGQKSLRFIERTADNWWHNGNTHEAQRDYFLMKTERGEWCWVFCNRDGKWYQHGLYC